MRSTISLHEALALLDFGQLEGRVCSSAHVPDLALHRYLTPAEMRKHGAQALHDLAQHRHLSYPDVILNSIYSALEDTNPSLRLLMVSTLFYCGDSTSVDPLEQLIVNEQSRIATEQAPDRRALVEAIISYARIAIVKCAGPDYDLLTHTDIPIVSVALADIHLAVQVVAAVEKARACLHICNEASELLWVPSRIQIVDHTCLDPDSWQSYCDMLNEDAQAGFPDSTPLVMISNPHPPAPELIPAKAEGALFIMPARAGEVVDSTIQHLLTHYTPAQRRQDAQAASLL